MNICVNAQLISDQAGYRGAGVNNYGRQLLRALGEAALAEQTEHVFTAFVHAAGLHIPGVVLVRSRLPLERPEARIVWEQSVLPAGTGTVQGPGCPWPGQCAAAGTRVCLAW